MKDHAMPLPPIAELVTHDGSFHADEVLATAVLADLFPGADIFRSRDVAMTSAAPGRIVYDVGYAHDPEQRLYDHHQPGAPRRDCGTPYSAFGLIWRDFGRAYLARRMSGALVEEAFERFDREMVLPVDAVDNGVTAPAQSGIFKGLTVFSLISDMLPSWKNDDGYSSNEAFDHAISLASGIVAARADAIASELEASAVVRRRIAAAEGPILLLKKNMPWHGPIFETGAEHILMVVHPRADGSWVVSTVPKAPGSYETRMDLPESWAGLQGADLQAASGFESAVFCHAKRFMAVTGTAQDAMEMAEEAISIAGLDHAMEP